VHKKFYKGKSFIESKMRGKLIFSFVFLLFLLQGAFAITTEITMKSLANADIKIIILQEGEQPGLIERIDVKTDKYGDAIISFSTDEATYRLATSIYIEERLILEGDTMAGLIPGEKVYVEILPEGFLPLQNPAKINNAVNETEEVNNNATGSITGDAINNESSEENSTGNAALKITLPARIELNRWAILVVICLIFGVAGVFGLKRKKKGPFKKKPEIKIVKLSEKKERAEKEEKEHKANRIEEAEKKLEALQKEIKELREEKEKSPKQIEMDKIKQRMIEDEKKLIKLRQEK
jgi:hypothetical protein